MRPARKPIVLTYKALKLIERRREIEREIAHEVTSLASDQNDNAIHAHELKEMSDVESVEMYDCFWCQECEHVRHANELHPDTMFCRDCTYKLDREAGSQARSNEQDYLFSKRGY